MKRSLLLSCVAVVLLVTSSCATQDAGGACGPDTCEGCCGEDGRCRLGQDVSACGAGGAACAVCTSDQSCTSGACQSPLGSGNDAGACADDGAPPPRSDFAAAFDPVGGDLILFGGDPGVATNCTPNPEFSGDTWFYSPACGTWRKGVGNAPSPRARHAGVFDTKRRRFVIFGGRYRAGTSGAYTVFNDTYALMLGVNGDLYYWDQLQPTGTPPPPLSSTTAVYDAQGDRLLVYGGNESTSGATFAPTGEVYALSFANNAWVKLQPATSTRPAARLFHSAVMDAKRNRLVVFGGGDANAFVGPFFNDAWAFDLNTLTWSELTLSGTKPQGRIRASRVEDDANDRALLFGGHDDGELGERNDLWAIDYASNAWVQLRAGDTFNMAGAGFCDFPSNFTTPDLQSPERREAHALVAMPNGGGHLMVGGRTDCGVVNDVWKLGAQNAWEQMKTSFVGLSCQRSGKANCTKLCF